METPMNDKEANVGLPDSNIGLESLREDNARLWKMIKDAQEASNSAGLIGMVGSPAWIWQIKKALSDTESCDYKLANDLHDLPPVGTPMRKLGQRLAELLDEDQWSECEQLLFEIMDETTYNPFRPIETAPNDGSWIVIARFGKNESGTEMRMWWISKGCWSEEWGKWWDGIEPSGLNNPTHWMPAPTAPNTERMG